MLKLILVEDEPDIQVVARLSLEYAGGFDVHCFSSGPDFLAGGGDIAADFVLLDVMMPGMDGMETLKQLRQCPWGGALPVIFLTAKVQTHEVAHYLELGALGVIAKPFHPVRFPQELRTLLGQP